MASVESIERQLMYEAAAGSAPSVASGEVPGHETQSDEEMVEAARILTSGMTQTHSAPSDVHSESSTETELSEGYTRDVEAIDPEGDMAVKAGSPDSYDQNPHDRVFPEDDLPISMVEEARSLELCHDYFTENPFASACLPTPPESFVGDLADPPGVQSIALRVALDVLNDANAYEKWDVDQESAGFLASVMALGRDSGSPLGLQDAHVTFSDLKIVKPLLQCDPDLELQRLKRRNHVTLSAQGIEPFLLDVEKGESFIWPSYELNLPLGKDVLIASEKLEVGRNVMEYLREIADPTAISYSEMVDAFIRSEKVPLRRPLTPPLMPLSPSFSPPTLPDDMLEMELTSTPQDLIAEDAAEVDRHIMAMDDVAAASTPSKSRKRAVDADMAVPAELYSGLNTPDNSSSSPLPRRRVQDLRVDIPVLPADSVEPPAKKTKMVSFPAELHTLIPQPDSDVSIMDPDVAQQDLNAFVKDIVMPFADSALQQAENEQLMEVDTTMRVEVPKIKDKAPTPAWQLYSGTTGTKSDMYAQRFLLAYIKRELLKGETSWSGVSKLERVLAWSPFPARLGKIKVDEEFDDDKSAARYMAQLAYEDEIELQDLISKTEGLRLLDAHDSDDEELEHAVHNDDDDDDDDDEDDDMLEAEETVAGPQQLPSLDTAHRIVAPNAKLASPPSKVQSGRPDMQTLLRRRKLELEKANEVRQGTGALAQRMPVSTGEVQKPRSIGAGLVPTKASELLNSSALTGFLHTQGLIAKRPDDRHGQASRAEQCAPRTTAALLPPPSEDTKSKASNIPSPPVPVLPFPDRNIQLVVSTRLLANRSLVRQLQALLCNLDLVERDSISNTAHVEWKTAKQGESADADVTMSPMAGLVITTLQKLKQKPLPGQTAFFGIRERIAAVSDRYEQLVVLVSEGRQTVADCPAQAQALDGRDCDALSDLMGFTAQLDADVEVKYVPGGEDELVSWVAASISSHCVSSDDTKLLPEETLWERFLRSAGMNAFAAQVILGKLKQPEANSMAESESSSTLQSTQGSCYGLPAFVRMSTEQRVQHFGPLLGGHSVLRRVSEVLDSGWTLSNGLK
ncbi:hypothetical protein LTR85_009780 [Meristemomyces frigidus]|nr:hypothetical protein LTR85_009780 [Meristemomyces frigidus]